MEPGPGLLRQTSMTVFTLDSAAVSALTNQLRADAGNLNPLHDISIPAVGPLATFSASVSGAIAGANLRAEELRTEARRIAQVMDRTAEAAANVEACTCAKLGAVL